MNNCQDPNSPARLVQTSPFGLSTRIRVEFLKFAQGPWVTFSIPCTWVPYPQALVSTAAISVCPNSGTAFLPNSAPQFVQTWVLCFCQTQAPRFSQTRSPRFCENGLRGLAKLGHCVFAKHGHRDLAKLGHRVFAKNGHRDLAKLGHRVFAKYGHRGFDKLGHQRFAKLGHCLDKLGHRVFAKHGHRGLSKLEHLGYAKLGHHGFTKPRPVFWAKWKCNDITAIGVVVVALFSLSMCIGSLQLPSLILTKSGNYSQACHSPL